MTVIGLDDTDSRERGMCTTFAAHRVAERLRERGADVARLVLVRLNPAIEHKTRGNAALAVHADVDPQVGFRVARDVVEATAAAADENTHPGVVVAPTADVPGPIADFAERAVQERLEVGEAEALVAAHGYASAGWKRGRGRIGALAAVGAWTAVDDWTHEQISYRESDRWGTERDVDPESTFAAAEAAYPDAWDTVDREEGELVCVPHTPGPILHGIRGDDPDAVRTVAERIESEPVASRELFATNQGTDAHLREGAIGDLDDGAAYRVTGTVASAPETKRGGHVFFDLADGGSGNDGSGGDGGNDDGSRSDERWEDSGDDESDRRGERDDSGESDEGRSDEDGRVRCAAFEPTKRFRDRVRALRAGDRITACGEVSDGTLKLEKFAVRDLRRTEPATPTCPDCGCRMKSAGATQGYRCRDCDTHADGKVERPIERDLEEGWYEVPPCARRHVAKPLIRGGFDAPIHPER